MTITMTKTDGAYRLFDVTDHPVTIRMDEDQDVFVSATVEDLPGDRRVGAEPYTDVTLERAVTAESAAEVNVDRHQAALEEAVLEALEREGFEL